MAEQVSPSGNLIHDQSVAFNSGEGTSSLQSLVAQFSLTATSRIDDFTRLAAAVQRQRRQRAVSDKDGITRSTALWSLLQLDADVREALESCGLSQEPLGALLSISGMPDPMDVEAAELDEDFAAAVRVYLSDRTGQGSFDVPELAIAILRSARDDSSGLLPSRLRQLNVDLDAALVAIERMAVRPSEPLAPAAPTARFEGAPSLEMLADRPVETDAGDRLGFSSYADALAELIDNPRTSTPLTVAISAPWGAGKTSLAKLVAARLTKGAELRGARYGHVRACCTKR